MNVGEGLKLTGDVHGASDYRQAHPYQLANGFL